MPNRKKRTPPKRGRGQLAPRSQPRGLEVTDIAITPESAEVAALADLIRGAGGAVLGAYRDPLGGKPLLLASLSIKSILPTPFQRDLSPTHVKRLAVKIEEAAAFLDPLVVVRGSAGQLWTPNGRHRLAAAKMLGMKQITALVSPDEGLAYRILALNTEKAHNLRDRSLEVIRMARGLLERKPGGREIDFKTEFESPELLTLGVAYERAARFAGGAYSSFLKKVDRFSERTLSASLRARDDYASRLIEIDGQVNKIITTLQARGLRSPYLRNYVVARINPVRLQKAAKSGSPLMPMSQALTRMAAAARIFKPESVRSTDLAWVAVGAGSSE